MPPYLKARPDIPESLTYSVVKRKLAEGALTPDEVKALAAGKKGGRKRRLLELVGGPPAMDSQAEELRLEHLKLEAAMRPPRTGKAPSNEYQTMTSTALRDHIEQVLTGEVIPAPVASEEPPIPGDYRTSETRLAMEGLEEITGRIEDGESLREICRSIGVRASHFNRWIASMPEGDTRVRDSRRKAAQAWLDRALEVLEDAVTLADLAKAREIAAICRKFASIADPSFSDRVQVDTTVKAEDPTSIDRKLAMIVAQVASKQVPQLPNSDESVTSSPETLAAPGSVVPDTGVKQ